VDLPAKSFDLERPGVAPPLLTGNVIKHRDNDNIAVLRLTVYFRLAISRFAHLYALSICITDQRRSAVTFNPRRTLQLLIDTASSSSATAASAKPGTSKPRPASRTCSHGPRPGPQTTHDGFFDVGHFPPVPEISPLWLRILKPEINLTNPGGKRGDYQNCSVLHCVLKLCTVISTIR